MRNKKGVVTCSLFVCFFSFFLVSLTVSVTGVEGEENDVIADITIVFSSGTSLHVDLTITVEKITLSASDTWYSGEEIESVSTSNPEIMGAIKYALKGMVTEQLRNTFKNAELIALTELPGYQDHKFYDEYNVTLTPGFFNMNETFNAHAFVNGLLDVGAIVNYSFSLQAFEGWENTYTFILPERIDYKRTTGSVENNEITWILKNNDGEHPEKKAEISLYHKKPTTAGINQDVITLAFIIDSRNPDETSLTTCMITKALATRLYDMLPDFMYNVSGVPADGIRLCVQNNFTSWDEIYTKTLQPIEWKTKRIIENSSLNQTLQLIFSWDPETTTNCSTPYNISHMDETPPVKALSTDESVDIEICGIPARAMFGLINAGAKVNISAEDVNFGDDLDKIGLPYVCSFYLPEHIYLNGSNKFNWSETQSISGKFTSDVSVTYNEQDIHTAVEIAIESTDLNLLSFFTGKTDLTLGVLLKETQNRNVTALPPTLHLPKKVSISYLNSDAFRVCVEENVFTSDEISLFLAEEKQLFKSRVQTMFPGLQLHMKTDENMFEESLRWDGNISQMSSDSPIKVVSYAHSTYPLSFSFSLIPPTFEILPHNITFTGVKNQNVTYTMIFPKGIWVEVNDTLGKAFVKEMGDGYAVEVTFSAAEANLTDVVSYKMIPSILFILGLFTPCILSIVIAVILFIVIYIIRKKRKERHPSSSFTGEDEYGYEEEDYYVPPPPPSSKQ